MVKGQGQKSGVVKVVFRRSKILTPVAALDTAPMRVTRQEAVLIAECLSARQLILLRISFCVCMYVCMCVCPSCLGMLIFCKRRVPVVISGMHAT